MKSLLQEAKGIEKDLIRIRRYLHQNAETGFNLNQTLTFVKSELEKLKITPKKCGKAGMVATIGQKGRVFLLRADMDALPIKEQTGVSYACKNGNMHACGHDMHATMLLGAARLLKERESALNGTVKLLFQPAEETLEGAKNAIDAGVLENPKVDGGMMLHVMTNVDLPVGTAVVAAGGVSAPAADYFTIKVRGKGCHGSAPWNGVDALTVAAHILIALQELSAREISLANPAVLTVGSLKTGEAGNAISDFAELQGTLRAFDEKTRENIKRRMEEMAKNIAKAFRANAKIIYGGGCPTLINDEKLSLFTEKSAKSLLGENAVFNAANLGGSTKENSGGSEDFAYISHAVPSVMVALAAGERTKGYNHPLHHPKVAFDESALPIGSALYAHIAVEYLKNK